MYGVAFQKSFFPYFTKKWNELPISIRGLPIFEFKIKLKSLLTPTKSRHFAYGPKLGNKLLTRLRVGRSYLNSHSFSIGKTPSPECKCHHPNETIMHYIMHCFLYTIERQSLFVQIAQVVPNFSNLPQYKQLDLLLNGYSNPDYHDENIEITKLIQKYILSSKRFLIRQ